MLAATMLGSAVGIDQHASLGFGGGDLPVRVAQFLMKLDVFRLESVGCACAAAGGRALQPDLHRNIENKGQIGLQIADGDPLHRIEKRGSDLPQRCPDTPASSPKSGRRAPIFPA